MLNININILNYVIIAVGLVLIIHGIKISKPEGDYDFFSPMAGGVCIIIGFIIPGIWFLRGCLS